VSKLRAARVRKDLFLQARPSRAPAVCANSA
jgi:hypothetical protein